MQNFPVLQVGIGLVFLVLQVRWIFIFFRRVDPWLRQRLGDYFGVTIRFEGKGAWKVVEKGQGCRGVLIEMLQIVFVIPVVMLPLMLFLVILMLLSSTPVA